MKPLAIALLLLALVSVGLPMAGMMSEMEPCPACVADDQVGAWGMCLAILALLAAMFVSAPAHRHFAAAKPFRPLLLSRRIEEPPRVA
jgi:hypothetical protein